MSKYKILEEYNKNLMYIDDILNKSTTTNNLELKHLGKSLFGELFIGVFSADKFPKYIRNNEMFIINNKSSKSKGEHWISFIKSSKNKDRKPRLYAYDSFSRDVHTLSPFFKNKRFINANINRDQAFIESDCGQRAMTYLISFYKHGDKVMSII